MRPVGEQIWERAFEPYDQDRIGLQQALVEAKEPLARFMLAQTSKDYQVAVVQDLGRAGYGVHDLVVDRGADRGRIALVALERGHSAR